MDQQRADLEVLRAGLLAAFESADDAVKAQIAGQLRAVVKDLAALAMPEEVNPVDDLATRRSDRRAKAKVSGRAAGGDVGG